MKITTISIENCKSYRDRETLELDDRFNILVGPNGGGKSNTLDIITIVLRRFFLREYVTQNREESWALYRDIEQSQAFSDIRRFLEPNLERIGNEVRVSLVLVVGQSDVDNLRVIREKWIEFKAAGASFRNSPFPSLDALVPLTKLELAVGDALTFDVVNGDLRHPSDPKHDGFRQYCESINLFLLLGSEGGVSGLKPPFTYFSPYRAAGGLDLRGNLSSDSFQAQLATYSNSSSHSPTSLLKLATLYFANLRRSLEINAKDAGFLAEWQADEVVRNVSRYLTRVGYQWDINVLDRGRNIYQIELKRDGRTFAIDQASSGEKEILTFVLGIFALRTSGGLILIDEPEVHLHPRWQSLLRSLLRELAEDTGNQLVLSTHSPVFITPETIGHVRRVYMASSGTTKVVRHIPRGKEKAVDHWHMLNSHNNEKVFFADKVVLVEGIQDRVLFEAMFKEAMAAIQFRGVVEVVEVHGKNNLKTYMEVLDSIGVPHATIADLDYLVDVAEAKLASLFEVEFGAVNRKVLRNKKSEDRETLADLMGAAIASGDMNALVPAWEYIKGRHRKLRGNLSEPERTALRDTVVALGKKGVHLLSRGEIEDYLPVAARSLAGTITMVRDAGFAAWLRAKGAETTELRQVILDILLGEGTYRPFEPGFA